MKFQVGDKVVITAGKDKGKTSVITEVRPKDGSVIVKDMNMYTRHVRPYQDRSGEKVRKERPLTPGKFMILNDKNQPDRIQIKVAKDGSKERVFAKTQKAIPDNRAKKK